MNEETKKMWEEDLKGFYVADDATSWGTIDVSSLAAIAGKGGMMNHKTVSISKVSNGYVVHYLENAGEDFHQERKIYSSLGAVIKDIAFFFVGLTSKCSACGLQDQEGES